jgi:hypothetical protein
MEKNRFKQLLESKMGNVKPLINEEEKLNEQTTGSTVSGYTVNNNPEKVTPREDKSQKSLEWGKGEVNGVVKEKQYPVTIMNMPPSNGETPVTFNMYIPTLKKSSSKDGSWLGYNMVIYDVKSKKMMDSLSIDCNTVDRCLKSNSWVQIDAYNKSEFKWYFNKDFLNDLKNTLLCKEPQKPLN